MKRLLIVLLVISLASLCCLTAYASTPDQVFNTQPGGLSEAAKQVQQNEVILTVSNIIAGVLLIGGTVLMIFEIIKYRRASRELHQFCTGMGWVKIVPNIHGCTKASLILIPVTLLTPVCMTLITAMLFTTASSGEDPLATFILSMLAGLIAVLVSCVISLVGLILAIIGCTKSRQKIVSIIPCVAHAIPFLFILSFCLK